MKNKNLFKREELKEEFKWNIEKMYPNDKLWENDINEVIDMANNFRRFQGKLKESSQLLYDALSEKDAIWQKLEKAYVYSRMKQDENNKDNKYQEMNGNCSSIISKISADMSFFTPELIEIPEENLLGFIKENPLLKKYVFLLNSMLREKEHILSKEEENILAKLSDVTDAPSDIFTILNNAELDFGEISNEEGLKVKLTHGNFINFMESHNREIRKSAYENMYHAYEKLNNTIATAYNYNVKNDVIIANIRNYSTSRAAALSSDNIPEKVYDNLIKVVNDNLPTLHKYIDLRKKVLGLEKLNMHDVYVPLIELPENKMNFNDGVDLMLKALAPLGEEYTAQLKNGVDSRWIDIYENEGKTSGAYSFGSYDSMPYVLLNYTNTLKDVFTLVHEMGHSMHSYYTRKTQPFIYGGHSIFTAEVASTVNEALLMQYLLNNEKDVEMKKYLLNLYIEEFRTTLFRQTMFAEFEELTHAYVESGNTLTSDWLNDQYYKLNKKYFGDALDDDNLIKYEWSRIPHFYRSFYVYQYATGYSAATAISKKILNEGKQASKDYIEFLKTGNSNYPVELLKIAGVDMSDSKPIEMAMETFKKLVDEFEELME